MKSTSLLAVVFKATGQDLRHCWRCGQCSVGLESGMDLTIWRLIHGVLVNDASVLQSDTLWSSRVMGQAAQLCSQGLNLEPILLALREEGWRRGIVETII